MSTKTQNNALESAELGAKVDAIVQIVQEMAQEKPTSVNAYGLSTWTKAKKLITDLVKSYSAPVAAQPDLTQQTLDDVMAGIPARDAETEALRKQVETLQAQLVDRSPEMQGKPVDESPNLQAQQQPASGADGLHSSIMEKVQEFASTWATVDGRFDDGTAIDRAEACKTQIGYILRNALSAQPQSSGNPGQLDHLPDATKMVEPSGNSGELHASFESWRKSELPWTSPATPGIGFAWDAWRARAAIDAARKEQA